MVEIQNNWKKNLTGSSNHKYTVKGERAQYTHVYPDFKFQISWETENKKGS